MLYLFRDAVENGLKELLVVFGLDGAHQGLVPPLLADLVVPFLVVNEVVDVGMEGRMKETVSWNYLLLNQILCHVFQLQVLNLDGCWAVEWTP